MQPFAATCALRGPVARRCRAGGAWCALSQALRAQPSRQGYGREIPGVLARTWRLRVRPRLVPLPLPRPLRLRPRTVMLRLFRQAALFRRMAALGLTLGLISRLVFMLRRRQK